MTLESLNKNLDAMANKEQREEAKKNGFLVKKDFDALSSYKFVIMRIQLLFKSDENLAHSNILVIDQRNAGKKKAYFFEPYADDISQK